MEKYLNILKEFKDSDGDNCKIFTRIGTDDIERLYFQVEIILREWISKYNTSFYKILTGKWKNDMYVHIKVDFDPNTACNMNRISGKNFNLKNYLENNQGLSRQDEIDELLKAQLFKSL